MLTPHLEHLVSLLLASFPNFQSGDADAALAAYAMVIGQADQRDVEAGVMMIINGQLPGFDGRFAPTATQLARAIRICLERRVDREIAERRALPPPPDDWVDDPPEVKARNRARMDELAASLAAQHRTEEAEADRRRDDLSQRTLARFYPDQEPRAAARRLGFLQVDPEDDEGDMGMSGAA